MALSCPIPLPAAHPELHGRALSPQSGVFGPSELIAVMGPSGSGKTTMLSALTGVMQPSEGSTKANGQPVDPAVLRRFTALVPQDDMLTPALTAQEALFEAACFKANATTGEAQKQTDQLLQQFGLLECRDVKIGHPEGTKGLSGGQRKRLSVALELTGNPSMLFLDEPTSGLDAVAALALAKDLRSLSGTGATVIATIHQPSAATFQCFQRLLLLASGKACYAGPISSTQPQAYFGDAGYPCPEFHNPADFVLEVRGTGWDC